MALILPARRVRRIEQSPFFNFVCKALGVHSRLNDRDKIAGVDFADPVHPRQRNDNTAADGHATADVAVSGAARGHGNVMAMGKSQKLCN